MPNKLLHQIQASPWGETASDMYQAARRQKLPLPLFFLLCLNLATAPMVQAATGETLSKPQAYAIALLGLVTVALSIYIFFVIFQPEKF
jgi:K+-transporting ATPase KdpF subunit